jgi:CIC family chloride channel protein
LIGVIAGLGAVAFFEALKLATRFFLHVLVAYNTPTAVAEGGSAASSGFSRPWAVPLVVGLGGLLAGVLVYRFAPEAEGHGTDAAIHAVNENPRGIRFRAVLVKFVASAITIGSGGSGGREGPTAQISAGFGSMLARFCNLSPSDGRIAVSVGIGSGIGAIFRAPLGGAVLAAEIVYRDDIEVEALLPAIIASGISYAVFGAFEGYTPIFGYAGAYQFEPLQLVWFAGIGILCGLIGLLYARGFYGISALFERLGVSRFLKPAIGGLMVGTMALAIPEVLGTGYGWVQQSLSRSGLLHMSLAIVLLIPFTRILATGLSVGSGGSGGIFGPGIVIGAFTGAGVWRLLEPFAPGIPHQPATFVIVGMMACFGSVSRAPIAVMLMVAEMTGSLEVIAPAMIAVGIATLIVRRSDTTIYRSQLRTRNDSPAHRLQFGLPLLSNVTVAEVMAPIRVALRAEHSVSEGLLQLREAGIPGGPVVDAGGVFLGAATLAQVENAAKVEPDMAIGRLVDVTAPTVQTSAALDIALEALGTTPEPWVTVTDSGDHAVGIFTSSRLIIGYRRALAVNTERLSKLAGNAVPVELHVGAGAEATGLAIRDAALPAGTIVVTVERKGALLFADGDTMLESGDRVSALVMPDEVSKLREKIEGSTDATVR